LSTLLCIVYGIINWNKGDWLYIKTILIIF
jgi:hypothetical protein